MARSKCADSTATGTSSARSTRMMRSRVVATVVGTPSPISYDPINSARTSPASVPGSLRRHARPNRGDVATEDRLTLREQPAAKAGHAGHLELLGHVESEQEVRQLTNGKVDHPAELNQRVHRWVHVDCPPVEMRSPHQYVARSAFEAK